MADLATIFQQFTDIRPGKDADHYEGSCPACRKKKKMSIAVGRYRVWVKCWANCDEGSILAAIGQGEDFLKFPREADPVINIPRRPAADPSFLPPTRILTARHREELEASGISEQIIADMGCWTCNDPEELRRLGFSQWQSRAVPCLVFPSHAPDGRMLYQMKPDRPFRGEDDKPIKYMSPVGAQSGLAVLPSIAGALIDKERALYITEGLKKAAAAISRGLVCISLSGVWNWQHTPDQEKRRLKEYDPLPDWEEIPLQDRTVYIAFDSDSVRKEAVYAALRALLSFLSARGAQVRIVYLPDGDEGEKTGLDDYFAAGHDVNDVLELADDALRPVAAEFGQEYIKAVNKRAKGAAVFTTTGATFANETEKALTAAVFARLAIGGQVRDADFWIGGESWLQAKKVYKRGELWERYSAKFGAAIAKRDADAARLCRKFPPDVRRANIRPWVYLAIESADADTQRLILDTYEADGLTRAEVRRLLNPGGGSTEAGEAKDRATNTLSHDMAAVQDLIPAEDRRDFVDVVSSLGWEHWHDFLQQQKRLLEAQRAAEIHRAHFGAENRENEGFEIANYPPAGNSTHFPAAESTSNSPSYNRGEEEGKTLHSKTENRVEGAFTDTELIEEARCNVAEYCRQSEEAECQVTSPPDRCAIARHRWPDLVAATEARTLPDVPCQIPREDGLRWEVGSLRNTAASVLRDFITLEEFSEREAASRLCAVDKARLLLAEKSD